MNSTATLEEIYSPISAQLERVRDTILEIVWTPNALAQEVVRYFFSSRGKLLRPALTFLGAHLVGRKPEFEDTLMRLGAALEIFHGATLIHDDIIDSAAVRRNMPTIHEKWTPQVAVLVGDHLHDRAMNVVFETKSEGLYSLFLKTAGEVCDGEILEYKEKRNFNLSERDYLEIIGKKTASLLSCAVASGGILMGANPLQQKALERFGFCFGKAFQIVDDCLDFTGNESDFGKNLGTDCSSGVVTLPLIHLLSRADKIQKEEILKMLEPEMSGKSRQNLLRALGECGAIDFAIRKANGFAQEARGELAAFEESPAKNSLDRLLDYVVERNH